MDMDTTRPIAPASTAARRLTLERAALAGIAAPIIFAGGIAISDALNRRWLVASGANPLRNAPVSINALGPYGWLMTMTFAVFGTLLLLFAIGLRRAVHPSGWSTAACAVQLAFGLTMLLSAASCDCAINGVEPPPTWHGAVHSLAFLGFMLTQLFLYAVMWRSLRLDARWRGYATYSLVTGIFAISSAPLLVFGGLPDLFSWFYLWLLAVPLQWTLVVAVRLRRLAQAMA